MYDCVFPIAWARQTAVVILPHRPQPLQHQHSKLHLPNLPLRPPPLPCPPLWVRVLVKPRKSSQQLFYQVRAYVKHFVTCCVTYTPVYPLFLYALEVSMISKEFVMTLSFMNCLHRCNLFKSLKLVCA